MTDLGLPGAAGLRGFEFNDGGVRGKMEKGTGRWDDLGFRVKGCQQLDLVLERPDVLP